MKREEKMNYDDVVRMKSKRRERKKLERSLTSERKSAGSKTVRKKTKKFVFNQNFNYDDFDAYDD